MSQTTKQKLITWGGTAASLVVGTGAQFLPPLWRELAVAVAGLVLGALHIPRPGDVKAEP
jgi:hypothetical protein